MVHSLLVMQFIDSLLSDATDAINLKISITMMMTEAKIIMMIIIMTTPMRMMRRSLNLDSISGDWLIIIPPSTHPGLQTFWREIVLISDFGGSGLVST